MKEKSEIEWAGCLSWLIGKDVIEIISDSNERNKLCGVKLSNFRKFIDIQFAQRKGFDNYHTRKI